VTGPAEPGCPAEVLAAVPWYPDELSREERDAVEAHAATCPDCRRELEARLSEADAAGPPPPDPDAAFTRVLARIEHDEAEKLHQWARAPRRRRAVRWLREREVPLPGTGTTVTVARGLSAAASFGVLLAAVALFLGVVPDGDGDGDVAARPVIDVVFRDDLPAREMAEALERIDGEIVAGPSRRGRYRVRLPEGASPEAAAQALADADLVLYAGPTR